MRATLRSPRRLSVAQAVAPTTDPISGSAVTWDWAHGISYLQRRWYLILVFAILVAGASAYYYWRSPDVYTATATFLPSDRAMSLSSLNPLGNEMLATGGALPIGLTNRSDLYAAMLRSTSVIAPLLDRQFPTSDGTRQVTLAQIVKTADVQIGLERVQRLLRTSVDRTTGICRLSLTLVDPAAAASVCNALIEALVSRGIGVHATGANRMREFLTERLDVVKEELADSERQLKGFRNQNRNFDQSSSPDLQLADERLSRQVALKSQLYLRLSQEYELARIEEKRDMADIQILDSAMVPTVKSGPHRVRSTVLAGMTSIPLAAVMLLLWRFVHVTTGGDTGRRVTTIARIPRSF